MSTTQQQTQQFNPAGGATYNQLQPGIGSTLGWYMGGGQAGPNAPGSPFQSPLFQAGMGQGITAANQSGQTAMSSLGSNMAAFGGGGSPGFLQSQVRQAGYNTSGLRQNAYWNALNSTVGSQMNATGMAANYRPLQTGQTQTTSGLGTWLPQVLGAGLSIGLAPFTGGASLLGLNGALSSSGRMAGALGNPMSQTGAMGIGSTPWNPYGGAGGAAGLGGMSYAPGTGGVGFGNAMLSGQAGAASGGLGPYSEV